MIDEQGKTVYSASSGAPLSQPSSATRDFNVSVNSSRFVFATGYTSSRMYGDATLLAFDAATRSATTLGTPAIDFAESSSAVPKADGAGVGYGYGFSTSVDRASRGGAH